MLFSLNQLKGFDIKAIDGEIGKLDEVYFDDGCWQTRYLVVNVGNWLLREQVLLIPQVVTGVDPQAKTIQVALTKEEVESSPDALEVTPVSRQREIALRRHYQWTPYWDVDPLATAGFGRMPYTIKAPNLGVKASVQLAEDPLTLSSPGMEEQASRPAGRDDQAMTPVDLRPSGRLRSSHEVNGYPILSQDGEVGHLEDFLMDPDLRFTRFLVVDTGGWLAGKKVVVPPTFVHKWEGSAIRMLLTKVQLENAPELSE